MTDYTATARKDGRWWVVQCNEEPGAISQVSRLDKAAEVHREAISFVADVPIEDVAVTIQPLMSQEVVDRIATGRDLRMSAADQERQATRNIQSAAAQLSREGWSLRDIGFVLGLSFQRVHQILVAQPSRPGDPARDVSLV